MSHRRFAAGMVFPLNVRLGRIRSVLLVVAAVTLTAPAPARACSVCGCGDPLVAAGDSVPYAGAWRFGLDVDVLSATARSDDEPDRTESLTQVTLRPVVVWSPIERLNIVLQVPLVRKDWTLSAAADSGPEHAHPTGIGDVDVGARIFLWDAVDLRAQRRQNVALTLGTSLPTGPNDAVVDGERIDEHAQLGTGAFGPYAGLLYAFHQDPWNLFVSLTGRARTLNEHGYRYGTAILWTAQLAYRVVERLAIRLGVDGRWAAQDRSAGEIQENTGGLVVSATPGASWNVWERLWLNAQVQIPFATLVRSADGRCDRDGGRAVGAALRGALVHDGLPGGCPFDELPRPAIALREGARD